MAGLRGSFRNFLDDWFRLGGYSLGDELVFNDETRIERMDIRVNHFKKYCLERIIYPSFII